MVGLGTMGAGIAQVCAQAGFEVVGRDVTPELCDAARARIDGRLARGVEKGRLTDDERTAALRRLQTTTDLADLAGCDLVVEAIVEELEPKRELLRELGRVVRPAAILATNTSALSVTAIATGAARPERVVGLHFFNPAPVLASGRGRAHGPRRGRGRRCGGRASHGASARSRSVCTDTPGFVVNRVLIPLLNDCVRVLDEAGVSPEDLDTAMRAGASWPIGPCALVDLIGVDVHVHAAEALWRAFREPRMAPPPRLRRMLEPGTSAARAAAVSSSTSDRVRTIEGR